MPPPASLKDGRYRSRGQLVKGWLNAAEGKKLEEYVDEVAKRRNEWPGFSVLLGQVGGGAEGGEQKLAYITNRARSGAGTKGDPLAAAEDGKPGGVEWIVGGGGGSSEASSSSRSGSACSGGLSNSVLSEPWAKVKTGRERFEGCQAKAYDGGEGSEEQLIEDLFETMGSAAGPVTDRAQMQASVLIPPLKLPFSSPAVPAVVEKESQLPSHLHGEKGPLDPAAPASASAAAALIAPAMSRGATPIGGRSANKTTAAAATALTATTGGANASRRTAWYATRTSTVILVRQDGEVTFVERDVHVLDAEGEPTRKGCGRESERRFDFRFAVGDGQAGLNGDGEARREEMQ